MAHYSNMLVIGVLIVFFCDSGFTSTCTVNTDISENYFYKSNYTDGVVVGKKIRDAAVPGAPDEKGMELELICSYKGGPFTKSIIVAGEGVYRDQEGYCHNNTVEVNKQYIFYLRNMGTYNKAIFTPDVGEIFLPEIILVCNLDRAKSTGVSDEEFSECPEMVDKVYCESYEGPKITPPPGYTVKPATDAPKPEPGSTTKAATPKPMATTQAPGKTGGQGDPNGAVVSLMSRVLCSVCILMCFLLH